VAARLTYTSGARSAEQDAAFESALRDARAADPDPWPHLVDGEERAQGAPFERRDPSRTERLASRACAADSALVAEAIAAARAAQPGWRRLGYGARASALHAAERAFRERAVEIAAVVTLETGKTRTESIAEVVEAADLIATYCEQLESHDGYRTPLGQLDEHEHNESVLRPYGVFGVIAPFNFPVALATGMATAALLGGNTVVLKPSDKTPWCGALVGEVLSQALPPGVLNLVQGGAQTGEALVGSDVDGIAFTGSADVGRRIAQRFQEGAYARPVLAEMGGKNPAIVMASADLDAAAEGIARAAFGLAGQKCSSCSRVVVEQSAHDDLLERLVARTRELVVGDPEDQATFLGPVADAGAVERFEQAVALAGPSAVVVGGNRPTRHGWFVEPTIVDGLPPGHDLTRRELFLPFLSVTSVAGLDDALREANAVRFGLTAGVFSGDQDEIDRFLDEIEAGVVYVNRSAGATTGAWPGIQSFCGWKSSGSTGKGGLGPYYVAQFMREQSRTVVS
jgi:1-pyrroline-5-carboxylate dehydrogenase